MRFKLRKLPEYEPENKELMFDMIKYAFLQRRKTLSNALSANKALSKDLIDAAIRDCGFDPRVRGEALSIGDFRRLSDALTKKM